MHDGNTKEHIPVDSLAENAQLSILNKIIGKITSSSYNDYNDIILETIKILMKYLNFDVGAGLIVSPIRDEPLVLYSPSPISDKHVKEIKDKFIEVVDNFSGISISIDTVYPRRNRDAADDTRKINSEFFAPIFDKLKSGTHITGFFFFSSFNRDSFSKDEIQFAFNVIGSVGQEIYRLHKVLKANQQKIMDILNNLDDGIILVNNDIIQHMNPTAIRYLTLLNGEKPGNTLEGIKGIPISKILKNDFHRPLMLETKESLNWVRRYFDIEVKALTTRKKDRDTLVILRDVTYLQKSIEFSKKKSKLEATGALAAGIAHDFNNLLTSITGFSKFLHEELDDPKLKSYAEIILSSGELGAKLVRQITDFAKPNVLDFTPIDLSATVKQTISLYWETFTPDIELVYHNPPTDRFYINGDPNKCFQVLSNLILNAKDAIEGEGRVSISLERVTGDTVPERSSDADEIWVKLVVSDDGRGIPKEVIDKVFEPFYTTKRRKKGTGLGLSQVESIVDQHEGSIEVESIPGEGSRFIVYFPTIEPQEPKTKEMQIEKTDFIELPQEDRSKYLVLVVEDDEPNRKLLLKFLEEKGFMVKGCEDGRAALEQLTSAKLPDVILSDIVMPNLNGIELKQELDELGIHTPILFMSGYPFLREEDEWGLKDLRILQKPLDLEALLQRIIEILVK